MDETVTVLGYHGTSRKAAETILTQGFLASENEYNWLGDGVCFWQDAPYRAWEWAGQMYGTECAVLVSRIELTECLDFLDITSSDFLSAAYTRFVNECNEKNAPLPLQQGKAHRLDCAVVNYACGTLAEQGNGVKVVRSAFREGKPIYPSSAFYDRTHLQIAVRDASAILETKQLKRENLP